MYFASLCMPPQPCLKRHIGFKVGNANCQLLAWGMQVDFIRVSEGIVFVVFGASAVAELSKLGKGLG